MSEMFCFQCEQTAGCTGCTGAAGVCGKSSDVANLQDKLTGALIALAQTAGTNAGDDARAIMVEGLFRHGDQRGLQRQCHQRAHRPCPRADGRHPDYDMQRIWNADEDIRSLKSLILFGLRGMAAYAYHARVLGYTDDAVDAFCFEGMAALAEDSGMDVLLPLVLKVGEINLACMALLDKANTETYGDPTPTDVPFEIEAGPFIIVTGHDLKDLELLLEQTDGKGVNIYTHGEMLPAHAYPKLKAHPQLKGNFGTAWQNQRKEFDGVPAPSCSPPTA